MSELNELLTRLQIEPIFGYDECFERAKTQHGVHGSAILTPDNASVLGKYADEVMRAARELLADCDNALYAYFIAELIALDDSDALRRVSCPRPSLGSVAYDILPMLALLWRLPDMIADHRRRGIPAEVTDDTVGMLENQIGDFLILRGHVGISFFTPWLSSFINCRIIRVGRFNLEMRKFGDKYRILQHGSHLVPLADGESYHSSGRVLGSRGCENDDGAYTPTFRETGECFEGAVCDGQFCNPAPRRFYKSDGWTLALSQGDPVVSVHIPTGGPLSPETCDRDLARGGDIIRRCFGDFKAYFCSSWLLDPQIRAVIGRETNITRFGDRFTRYPIKSNAGAVIEYVWGMPSDTPPQKLPHRNSFSDAIGAHLLSGGYIYGAAGVFMADDLI